MKKALVAIPLVVGATAAAVAGTSHYAGNQTQTHYQQLLAQLNDLSPLVFVNEQYDSGLSNSSAITKVLASRAADAEVLFRLHHEVNHSPVRIGDEGMAIGTVSINTTLHNETSMPPELTSALTDDKPFTLLTDVRFDGEIRNQLTVSGLKKSEGSETLSWSGMNFDGVTKDGATAGTGSMGALSFNDDSTGAVLNVEESPLNLDVQNHGGSIYTGTFDVAFNKISLTNPAMPVPVSIETVSLASSTDMKDDTLNGTTSLNLKGIDSPLPLKQASLDVQVNGLLVEGLRQYNSLMADIGSEPEKILGDPEFVAKIGGSLREMVKPGSAIKYALALANDEGDVDANLHFGVKKGSEEGMSTDALANIVTGRDLLNVLAVNGNLEADTAALAQTPVLMMLGGVGDYFTITDESIKSDVNLNGSTLVINGVELPLDMMAGGMLDVPFSDLIQM